MVKKPVKGKRGPRLKREDLVVLRCSEVESRLEVVDLAVALEENNGSDRKFSVNLRIGYWEYHDSLENETVPIGEATRVNPVYRKRPLAILGVFNRRKVLHLDRMVDCALEANEA